MASVDLVDATGVGVLTEASKRVASHGGTLCLVLTRDPILKILEMTGPGAFPIYRSRDEALQHTGG
jgi:anti-anti-sigma factor